MPMSARPAADHLEVLPLVVVAQVFPARPSALPDIRDFVRRQLTTTAVSDDDVRTLCDRVADVLLDAAGTSGTIQISLRIFPEAAEVDVLFAPDHAPAPQPGRNGGGPGDPVSLGNGPLLDGSAQATVYRPIPGAAGQAPNTGSPSFAVWLSARLRSEGLTIEAAARKLEVSTKTVSRWMSGTTEPRLRDLYRIRDAFGEPPFH
jgi:hypothetical protein